MSLPRDPAALWWRLQNEKQVCDEEGCNRPAVYRRLVPPEGTHYIPAFCVEHTLAHNALTTVSFWDCECGKEEDYYGYIHPREIAYCLYCETTREDGADSCIEEVERMLEVRLGNVQGSSQLI
jgi:hypothetical protein